jgi:hypothetical protein
MAILLPAAPTEAQTGSPTAMIWIDSPTEGATISNGTQTLIGGWAVDSAGPGSGITEVRVYLDARMESGGTLIGTATYGKPRPDVATAHGNQNYTNSGYDLLWTPSGLSAGPHTLYVHARSSTSGAWSFKTVSVTVRAGSASMPSGQYDDRYRDPFDDRYRDPFGRNYDPFMGPYGRPPGYFPPYSPLYPRPLPPGYPYNTPNPQDRVCILIYPPPPGCQY